MNDFQYAILFVITVPAIGFVVVKIINHSVRIKASEINQESIRTEMKSLSSQVDKSANELKAAFNDMRGEVKSEIGIISQRFDVFIKSEIDELKAMNRRK